ncbi:MAG: hypothetical protein V3U87_02935 [Methylococcaceae bacterium]
MSSKTLLEIIIVPLTVVVIGTYATISTTNTQIESAQTLADTQANRSRLNQLEQKNIDITKASLEYISSNKTCNGKLDELNLLVSMATPDHSEKLIKIITKKCNINESSDEARNLSNAVERSKENEINTLISELSGENRRTARAELSSQYLSNPELTSKLISQAINNNKNSYRILLGVLVALANAGYKLDKDTELGESILLISKMGSYKNSTLRSWYSKVVN